MSYHSHATFSHDASHHEHPQHYPHLLSRPSASYDHPSPPHTPYAASSAHPWSAQRSFVPPRLPVPRNLPAIATRYPHAEPTPLRSSIADTYASVTSSSRDVRFDSHDRPHSLATDLARFPLDLASHPHSPHHSDEPIGQYAPPPSTSLSIYTRSSEPTPQRTPHDSFDLAKASNDAHPSFFRHDRRKLDSSPPQRCASSSDHRDRTVPDFPSLTPYPNPRTDHSQPHHDQPRHHQDRSESRRPSHAFAPEPKDAARYRAEPKDATWIAPRLYPSAKRPLPQDRQPDVDPQPLLTPPSRSYSSSASVANYAYESSTLPQAKPVYIAPSSHDRHPQERDAPLQPPTPRHLPASAALGASDASAPALPQAPCVHQADPSITSQHPMQPNRKRLRISRACDECRRRKTRCDIIGAFPGEPGHPLTISGAVPPLEPHMEPKGDMLILQPCMNCRRSQVTCTYSKRPLKRGPSKGYIKDLERRLNSLESQIVSADRPDAETDERQQDHLSIPTVSAPPPPSSPPKPKVRTEVRISRLESVLARPSTAKSEDSKSFLTDSSRRSSQSDHFHIKPETHPAIESHLDTLEINTLENAHHAAAQTGKVDSEPSQSVSAASSMVSPQQTYSSAASRPESSMVETQPTTNSKGKRKAVRRPATSSPSRASDIDIAQVKAKVVTSFLHATFPVVAMRNEGESSRTANRINTQNTSNIARLEDRVLVRGMRLLVEPVEMLTSQHDAQTTKSQAHAARVASLIGQASAGLGGPREELIRQAGSGTDALRALRKVAHRLSGQEADLLMLCHLDQLRNGHNNNSALAAAVSKLGSGCNVQNDPETYRRRTLLFMLDRWHAIAFETPHLLMGRFGVERQSFRSMKDALGDVSQLALGEGVYEVLRCAIMLGQLNDLVQSNGGWKAVSKSDVEAVIHSAMDENERATTLDPSPSSQVSSSIDASQADSACPDVLSTAALRYSLENLVRCYHALHTLPNARDVTLDDLHRMFNLAESVVVLGSAKTPISLQGKLVQSAIGPSVLAVAGIAFSWCLRIICMMVASSLGTGAKRIGTRPSPTDAQASTTDTLASSVSRTSFPLEFYRRRIFDYMRMCGPFCLFSGGAPTSTASFAPVYLRLALYFNSTVSYASQVGSLVSPQSTRSSPVHQDATALGSDADNLLFMANEMGALGYILAATSLADAYSLLTTDRAHA